MPPPIPFDILQRYRGIFASLATHRVRGWVLDVGGGGGAAATLADNGQRVVVADRAAVDAPGLRADAARLPHPAASFDAVISADLLEHIPEQGRETVLREMLRVARGPVVVAAPFADQRVAAAERALDALVRERLGRSHPALQEHRAHGLPDLRAAVAVLEAGSRSVSVAPNGALRTWLPFMLADWYLADHAALAPLREQLAGYYGETLVEDDPSEPAYRHILTSVPAATSAPGSPAGSGEAGGAEQEIDWDGLRALCELFRCDEVRAADDARARAERHSAQLERELADLRDALDHRESHIADLDRSLRHHAEELERLRAFRRRFTHSVAGRAWRMLREHAP